MKRKRRALDKVEVMLAQLRSDFRSTSPDAKGSWVLESFYLACIIIFEVLGEDWFDKYVKPYIVKPPSPAEEQSRRVVEAALRVVDLAEVLLNLQHIQGFDDCIKRMQQGDIEGTLAELDLGRMLYLNKVPFHYVTRRGIKGADYDLEIIYPDETRACAEAKWKDAKTDFSETSLKNSLYTARKQLPANLPGIIFIKSPQHWLDIPELATIQKGVALEFLRATEKIVSVKFYISHIFIEGDLIRFDQGWLEVNNPWNRFDSKRDWNLFHTFDLHPKKLCSSYPWYRILPKGRYLH